MKVPSTRNLKIQNFYSQHNYRMYQSPKYRHTMSKVHDEIPIFFLSLDSIDIHSLEACIIILLLVTRDLDLLSHYSCSKIPSRCQNKQAQFHNNEPVIIQMKKSFKQTLKRTHKRISEKRMQSFQFKRY